MFLDPLVRICPELGILTNVRKKNSSMDTEEKMPGYGNEETGQDTLNVEKIYRGNTGKRPEPLSHKGTTKTQRNHQHIEEPSAH